MLNEKMRNQRHVFRFKYIQECCSVFMCARANCAQKEKDHSRSYLYEMRLHETSDSSKTNTACEREYVPLGAACITKSNLYMYDRIVVDISWRLVRCVAS